MFSFLHGDIERQMNYHSSFAVNCYMEKYICDIKCTQSFGAVIVQSLNLETPIHTQLKKPLDTQGL